MLSRRLQTIASLVNQGSFVVDIGTDHAYIPIYLIEQNITNKVIASDVSNKVIEGARKNIERRNLGEKITLRVSDGLKNISEAVDEAIISGMGTETIKKILKYPRIPHTLIIQSNNNLAELRMFMKNLGYKIEKEIVVFDGIYYDIIKYEKGIDNLTEEEIIFGKSNNLNYYRYLKEYYKDLYEKSKLDKYKILEEKIDNFIERRRDLLDYAEV